jgi:hypothetical protein
MDELMRMANDQEKRLVESVLRDLINRRADKATGEIRYVVVMSDGGIRERSLETKIKVR